MRVRSHASHDDCGMPQALGPQLNHAYHTPEKVLHQFQPANFQEVPANYKETGQLLLLPNSDFLW